MKWIVSVVIMLLAMGCQTDPTIAVSALTATDLDSAQNESVLRVELEQETATVGIQTHMIGVHGEGQYYSVLVGAPLPVEPGILGKPYFRYMAGIPTEDEDGGFHGPVLGTSYEVTEKIDTIVEGWYRSFNGNLKDADYADRWKAVAGVRYRF